MTFVEFHADLARVANALERIAHFLEVLAIPVPAGDVKVQQATLDDLHTFSPEDLARQQEEQLLFAERYRVAPVSTAMMEALRIEWEEQQRSIHGESWKPPENWKAIYAAAAGGAFRESEEPSAAASGRSR